MKVLFLCNKSPFPAREGGPIAMNSLIEGMIQAGHQVKVLAVNSYKYNVSLEEIPEEYKAKTGLELVFLDLKIKPLDAFLNLFSGSSYHVERFISPIFRKKLVAILQHHQFDVVQLETLFMVPYVGEIRKYSKAKIVLRAHNIEHLIWKRLSQQTGFFIKRWYLEHLTKTLKRFELKALDQVDGIAAITRKDAAFFRGLTSMPVIDVPFGLTLSQHMVQESPKALPDFFHIGAMNWIPNEEGIRWFLDEVWPEVHKKYPEIQFHLAGRYMPAWCVDGYRPQIKVWGEVENANDFVQKHDIAIVPLLSGSGIRIKIIEAMALGKAVITTEVGAEGILYQNDVNILIADTKTEFINAIEKCLDNPGFYHEVGKNAKALIETVYDNKQIVSRLLLFYEHIRRHAAQ
jgi:glycosyltransferase involved in cell wall biosynthesis